MSSSGLAVDGVSVRFGGVQALADVSFEIGGGEVVGIIGPNGAGKSTLLNVISGLIKPQQGRVSYQGAEIGRRPPRTRVRVGIGRTFQGLDVSPADTVLDNALIGAVHRSPAYLGWGFVFQARGRPEWSARRAEAFERLEMLGIAEWADRRMGDVPFAVQKRAQVARALMAHPSILLLDEPASGMSGNERKDLSRALRELAQQTKISLLVIEHDVRFMLEICPRLVALNFGRIIAMGSADDVIRDESVMSAYLGEPEAGAD